MTRTSTKEIIKIGANTNENKKRKTRKKINKYKNGS